MEQVADPQPVLQETVAWNNGDAAQYYTWFVNNHDAPNFPPCAARVHMDLIFTSSNGAMDRTFHFLHFTKGCWKIH
jgi:hypothetical protein